MFSLSACLAGGVNVVEHAEDWFEGGPVCSVENMVLDVGLIQTVRPCVKPVVIDDDLLGFDAIRKVELGGHSLAWRPPRPGLATKCRQWGVDIRAGVEVQAYDMVGDRITGVITNQGTIKADVVIIFAGA